LESLCESPALFHPMMSFVLPLAVGCILFPALRRYFPDLAWFSGKTFGARLFRIYLVLSLFPIVAMNSQGAGHLLWNLGIA